MHSILVKDFMDRNPHALPEQASVRDAVLFLCSEKIAGAPVVNSEGIVVGYDARFLSAQYAQDCAAVLADEGIKVWLSAEMLSSPALTWLSGSRRSR